MPNSITLSIPTVTSFSSFPQDSASHRPIPLTKMASLSSRSPHPPTGAPFSQCSSLANARYSSQGSPPLTSSATFVHSPLHQKLPENSNGSSHQVPTPLVAKSGRSRISIHASWSRLTGESGASVARAGISKNKGVSSPSSQYQ